MKKERFYIDSLDGIRALAIMLVFFSHVGYGHQIPGGFGVTVFFFLSGYLITTLLRIELQKSGAISFRNFYLRRAYRILPPFYIALLTALVLTLFIDEPIKFSARTVFFQACHLTNYYQVFVDKNIIPETSLFWSLAVEEHYYLFFPLFFHLIFRARKYLNPPLCFLLLCLLDLLWRCYLVISLGVPAKYTNVATDARIDSILYGCILGCWMNPVLDRIPSFSERKKATILGISLGLLMFTFLYRAPVFRETFRYSLQGIALIPVFFLAISRPKWLFFQPLNWNIVKGMGKISYTFYLFHLMMIRALYEFLDAMGLDGRWLVISVSFLITLLIAIGMYYVVEQPLASFRRRLQ